MDPVTILGAVGSVVGIAAFGFKLAQFVEKTFEEFNAADATLRNILHNVKSISYALNEIEQLLRQERENLRTRGKAVLFSPRAIHDMQSMTDKCVEIFWYIEGTIARTEKPRDLEVWVLRKQLAWKNSIPVASNDEIPTVTIDISHKLPKRQRVKLLYKNGTNLEKYVAELERQQSGLSLILQIVNFRANISNLALGNRDILEIPRILAQIKEMYLRSGLYDKNQDDTEWDARQRLELEQEFEILNRQKAVRYEDVPVHERPVLGEKQGLVGLNGRAHEPFSSARSNERASYDTRPTRRQRANSPPPQKAPPTRKERVDRQDSQVSETPETKLAARMFRDAQQHITKAQPFQQSFPSKSVPNKNAGLDPEGMPFSASPTPMEETEDASLHPEHGSVSSVTSRRQKEKLRHAESANADDSLKKRTQYRQPTVMDHTIETDVEALRSSTKRAHSATPPPDNSVPQVDGACLRKPDAAGDGAPSAEEGEFVNRNARISSHDESIGNSTTNSISNKRAIRKDSSEPAVDNTSHRQDAVSVPALRRSRPSLSLTEVWSDSQAPMRKPSILNKIREDQPDIQKGGSKQLRKQAIHQVSLLTEDEDDTFKAQEYHRTNGDVRDHVNKEQPIQKSHDPPKVPHARIHINNGAQQNSIRRNNGEKSFYSESDSSSFHEKQPEAETSQHSTKKPSRQQKIVEDVLKSTNNVAESDTKSKEFHSSSKSRDLLTAQSSGEHHTDVFGRSERKSQGRMHPISPEIANQKPNSITSIPSETHRKSRPTSSATARSVSGVSYGSEETKKRTVVAQALRRVARLDYMSQDDLEKMFGPGALITAFVIRGREYQQIPCAGHFSMRKRQMSDMRSSGSISWKDFAFLGSDEVSTLAEILEADEGYGKALVELKWVRGEKVRPWLTSKKVLVAIIYNEKLSPEGGHREDGDGSTRYLDPKPLLPADLKWKLRREDPRGVQKPKEAILAANYAVYTIRMSDPYDPRSISAPFAPTATREQFSEESVVNHIAELNKHPPNVIEKKTRSWPQVQEQIDLIVDQMRAQEGNSGFEWNLAQLDDFTAVTAGLLTMVVYLKRDPRGRPFEPSPRKEEPLQTQERPIAEPSAGNQGSGFSNGLPRPRTSYHSSRSASPSSFSWREGFDMDYARRSTMPRNSLRYEYELRRPSSPSPFAPPPFGAQSRAAYVPAPVRAQNYTDYTTPAVPAQDYPGYGYGSAPVPTQGYPSNVYGRPPPRLPTQSYPSNVYGSAPAPVPYQDREHSNKARPVIADRVGREFNRSPTRAHHTSTFGTRDPSPDASNRWNDRQDTIRPRDASRDAAGRKHSESDRMPPPPNRTGADRIPTPTMDRRRYDMLSEQEKRRRDTSNDHYKDMNLDISRRPQPPRHQEMTLRPSNAFRQASHPLEDDRPPRRPQMPYPEYYDGKSFNLRPRKDSVDDIVKELLLEWTPAGDADKEGEGGKSPDVGWGAFGSKGKKPAEGRDGEEGTGKGGGGNKSTPLTWATLNAEAERTAKRGEMRNGGVDMKINGSQSSNGSVESVETLGTVDTRDLVEDD